MAGCTEESCPSLDSRSLYCKALQCLRLGELNSVELPPDSAARGSPTVTPSPASEVERILSEIELPLPNFPSAFPTIKRIPGTRFIVDGFRSAGPFSVSYFLSHFHSDHYTGITPLWNKGLIFCSDITASLLLQSLKVSESLVVSLPMGESARIDGVDVILVDANHCPGAVQFLFQVPEEDTYKGVQNYHRYVHTGDMRYTPSMKDDPSFADFVGADAVFLDTTYCNPKFIFPSQKESVDYVAEIIHKLMQGGEIDAGDCDVNDVDDTIAGLHENSTTREGEDCMKSDLDGVTKVQDISTEPLASGVPDEAGLASEDLYPVVRQLGISSVKNSTLFLISTYVIGKEKILTAVAKRCKCLLYVNERKLSILKCLNLEDIEIFTTDPAASNVHVVGWSFLGETWPYFRPNFGNMEKFLTESGFSRVVGFVPTGWTYELKKKTFSVKRKGSCEIHLVPYSEHSNYDELREFVAFLRPKEIIPTVGLEGGGVDGKAVAAMRNHFRNLVDETASKKKFLKGFSRKVEENDHLARSLADRKNFPGLEREDPNGKENAAEAGPATRLQNVVTKVEEPLPRAAFGRGARKRRRDNDKLISNAGEEDDLDLGSQINIEQKIKESRGYEAAFAMPINNSVNPGLASAMVTRSLLTTQDSSFMNDLAPCLNSGAEKEEQLRSILPAWVSQGQIRRLLAQANGDVNAAVSHFYEREMDLMDESAAGQEPPASNLVEEVGGSSGSTRNSKQENIVILSLDQNTWSVEGTRVVSTGPTCSQASPLGKKAINTIVSNVSSSKPKPRSLQTSKAGKRKAKTPAYLSPSKKQGLQPTILTFFKKVVPELSQNVKSLASSDQEMTEPLDVCGTPSDEAESANLAGEDIETQAKQVVINSASTEQQEKRSDKLTQVAATEVEERYVEPGESAETDPSEWSDGISQLLIILDGNISKETAQRLLERGHGDVAKALDLHCNRPLKTEGAQISPCNTVTSGISIGGVITATEQYHETGVSSVAEDSDFTFVKQESANNDVEVFMSRAPDSAAEPRGFSSLMSSVSNQSRGSIATPVGRYNPIADACWEVGEPAPFVHLARAFDLVEHESGRLKTTDMLCNMFRSLLALSPEDVLPAVYLATNRIAPDFENTDLNIGGSTVAAAISEATGTQRAKLRDMYNTIGDLGDVAQACRQNQSMLRPPPPLRIRQVFATLHQISKESGSGSGARKKSLVLGLLRACREKETKYLVRTLVQNMRIGAMMRTVLPALAQAVVIHKILPCDRPAEKAHESLKAKLQVASAAAVEAYNFLPNLDLLVPTLINEGPESLSECVCVSSGTPIKPMLAKITNGIPEVLKRFQGKAFTCEYKYDGQRAQIHMLPNGSVRIFSRNGEDNTARFPDVADIVRSAMQPETQLFIIDAEVVAVDRENGNKLMAFQHLSTRERGTKDGSSINVQNIKVEVCVFLFDVMLANGDPLVKCPFRERRKHMHKLFPNLRPGYFQYANEITVEAQEAEPDLLSTSQSLDLFLDDSFEASCEGLMAKALDEEATYMASKRSDSWLKVKRDYVQGLHDTLDLVPIGAWHGNGRKAGWYSPFLVACYDPDREEYQSVCRVMSGFSDAFYRETKEFYSEERQLPRKPVYYQTGEECDVWFSAEVVWEIRGADLTISPVHQAGIGLVHPSRGMSMRFPRFISVRTDKKPENASSPSDIADLYHRQTRKLDVPGMGAKEKADSD